MDVGQRERGVQLLAREVVEEADVRQPFDLLRRADLGHPRAVADEEEDEVVAVAESSGGVKELAR